MKALLAEGADVNGTNQGGQTPLMLAALMGQQEIVSLLLDAGADAQLQDNHGLTALEWSKRRGFWEVSELLKSASPTVTLPPKATSDSLHSEEEEEFQPDIAPPVNPTESKEDTFGPAAKAALKSLQARRESEDTPAVAPEPPEAQYVLTLPEPRETGAYEALDPDMMMVEATLLEPSTDLDSQPGGMTMDVAAESESTTLLPGSQSHSLDAALEEPSADLTSVRPGPESFEAVSQTEQEQTLMSASPRAAIETNLPEATSSPELVTSEPSKPLSTRFWAVSASEPAPAFQTSTLGLSTLTTSGGASELANRKRCPQCGTIFENTPLEYCTRDSARLISIDAFGLTSGSSPASTRPLVWLLMAVVLAGSAFVSYRITWYFWTKEAPKSIGAPPVEPAPEVKKVTPTVGGALAGLELNIPEAEYPVEAERAGLSGPVTVQIKVNKKGRVVSAQSSTADRKLSAAAVKAARKATFSPEKLAQLSPRGVVVSGSITYEFAPTPTGATGAATSSPGGTSSPTDSATVDTTPTTSADPQSPVVGGPLVGTAINMPAAEYPSRAKRAGITGAITVTVRVNRAGKVISWRTSTGDSQLRAAALKAAKKATFSREKLPGTGDVVGTITYRFL